jgi:hypothetical protein
MRFPCPECGSTRSRKVDAQQSFQVHASRACRDCGHVWEPPASRGLLRFGVVVGLAWFAFGATLAVAGPVVNGDPFEPRYLWMMGAGLTAMVGCWRRLARGTTAG